MVAKSKTPSFTSKAKPIKDAKSGERRGATVSPFKRHEGPKAKMQLGPSKPHAPFGKGETKEKKGKK